MSKQPNVAAAVARLLTGHYAPQDVLDVCRAATAANDATKDAKPEATAPPPGAALVMTGVVTGQGMKGIGNRLLKTAVISGAVSDWPEMVEVELHTSSNSQADRVMLASREVDIYVTPHKSFPTPPIGWVSVNDAIPNNGQRVIARYDGVYDYRLVEFWYNIPTNFHFGSPNEPDGKGSQPATHWHPLPPPP